MRERVAIVGGGIAGLCAALDLSKDHAVTLLEARERFGGRIFTDRPAGIPHELGAEFVHGSAPEIWHVIKSAGLKTHEVPDRHWKVSGGKLIELADCWEQLGAVTEEIDGRKRDRSFARLLECVRQPKEAVGLARGFVEGFHAAPVEKASVEAIRLNEESSSAIDGQRQFRVTAGYDRVVDFAIEQCRNAGVQLRAKTMVKSVDWQQRPAKLVTDGGEFEAERVIITLPIGVLNAGGIEFIPEPRSKREAIEALEMGVVCKVVLQFRERFWPERNFGFIHTEDEWFQTWWADERGDVLTAWAGGPAGEKVSDFDRGFAVERALEAVSKPFGERLPRIRELLVAESTHNWMKDRFSRGAYSFVPVNGVDACCELARGEGGVLFFAGEATDANYQFGTVHGAIASGIRAARDVRGVK